MPHTPTDPPLTGIKVIEFAGLAPGPFCGLVLADWGASVIRIDRPDQTTSHDLLTRGKRSLAVNLKLPSGLDLAKKLISEADVLIDPFRPGVLEKLGLGPDVFLGESGLNKKLVYTRLAGFARDGHHKSMAAISGVLSLLPHAGPGGRPSFPLNLLADFAGGGFTAANGIILALFERSRSGLGQVVETDMVAGTRYLSSFPIIHHLQRTMYFSKPVGSNMLDGGAPFYAVYQCKDGGWFTLAALEPQFYSKFLKSFLDALPPSFTVSNLERVPNTWRPTVQNQGNRKEWDDLRKFIEAGFLTKTRDEWTTIFDGVDACALPVLTPSEAAVHSHVSSSVPQPHPILSRTPAPNSIPNNVSVQKLDEISSIEPGQHTEEILREIGISAIDIKELESQGAIKAVL
ncbi:hypothetical protein Clacol_002408 [Clathrus columnatus]|uniref:Alpha-methylacyl-CoA racemase n=1 Tax=Clathrus columnatus TaxID=1419009 RepID=A0AAV5A8I6_9AGAM|nr:hypothetical protein Clacol_002408 [Clathrus columnatus]